MDHKLKKKVEMGDEQIYNSDDGDDYDDIPENVHNRLLGAVSKLYKKRRVEAPTRKEPTLQESEFHLTSTRDAKRNGVDVSNLTKVLGKKSAHADIKQQISSAKNKSKRLSKPLETIEAEKVERIVSYDYLKKDLNKWNAVVLHQRAAEQVTFPLPKSKVETRNNSSDLLTTFKTPTPLEKQISEILKASRAFRNENVDSGEVVEKEPPIPLTLKEMMEQRSLMAKMRAQQRYKETKAARQNKIKSKKFHRIQRKEKIKAQMKEFEELQKKDPEAALKKLEQLEKARAQERASLRHRTTGHWAKNLQVRAKYDKEARIALAEQLQKSRELTRKLKEDTSSEEEFEGTDEGDVEANVEQNTQGNSGGTLKKRINEDYGNKESCKKSKVDFDDLFYNIEDKLVENVGKKVKTLNQQVKNSKLSPKKVKTSSVDGESSLPDLGSGLEMRRKVKTSQVDEALNETTDKESSVQSSAGQWIVKAVALSEDTETETVQNTKHTDIEPVETLQVKPKFLKTLVPTDLADREDIDDDETDTNRAAESHNMTIAEAFADDDVVREFQTEKEDEIKKSQIEDVNLLLPGWGSWGGHDIKVNERKREKFIIKFPKVLPRRDENKGNVVVNEDNDATVKPLLVSDVPFPFTSVKDFEASIRAPIGSTFLPQKAFRKLTAPTIQTKMGTIIEPMNEDQIVQLVS